MYIKTKVILAPHGLTKPVIYVPLLRLGRLSAFHVPCAISYETDTALRENLYKAVITFSNEGVKPKEELYGTVIGELEFTPHSGWWTTPFYTPEPHFQLRVAEFYFGTPVTNGKALWVQFEIFIWCGITVALVFGLYHIW